MNSDVGAASLSMPLALDVLHHGHRSHHSHRRHSGESGGKTSNSYPFCGSDAKVACIALTVAASASLAIAAANVFLFVRRARLVKRGENLEPASPRAVTSSRERLLPNSSASASFSSSTARGASPGTLAAVVAAALAVSHLASASSAPAATPAAPDSELYHLCLAATWATAAALCGFAASCRRAPRVRPVAWTAPLLYVVEIAVVLSRPEGATPSSSSPPSRVPLFSALARLCVALALAVSQARRGLSAVDLEEDALVTRALLAGPGASSASPSSSSSRRDVEAPAGPFSAPRAPSRGWISLLGVAIAFVWPEEPAHQVIFFLRRKFLLHKVGRSFFSSFERRKKICKPFYFLKKKKKKKN